MPAPQNIVAVIFDFDDTLTDDSTTKLLEEHGVDPGNFWKQHKRSVQAGWNPTLSYLRLLVDEVGEGKPLGNMSNADLRRFGTALTFYSGLPRLFTDLQKMVRRFPLSNPAIEFYVISGGLEEIIRGSKIAKHLSGIWGCRFAEGPDGAIRHVTNVVTFTEKTRYLFEINKGVTEDARKNPYAVNKAVKEEDRRIPFRNMIYLGDGYTDVPCFSLIEKFGGKAYGVFDPRKEGAPRKAIELVAPRRVRTINAPRYRKTDELGALLRAEVQNLCMNLDLETKRY
jgi:hypothetical protein